MFDDFDTTIQSDEFYNMMVEFENRLAMEYNPDNDANNPDNMVER